MNLTEFIVIDQPTTEIQFIFICYAKKTSCYYVLTVKKKYIQKGISLSEPNTSLFIFL